MGNEERIKAEETGLLRCFPEISLSSCLTHSSSVGKGFGEASPPGGRGTNPYLPPECPFHGKPPENRL